MISRQVARLCATAVSVFTAAASAGSLQAAPRPELWFAGVDPATRVLRYPAEPPSDFAAMFQDTAAWQEVARSTRVFQLPPGLVMKGDEGLLRKIFAYLKQRNLPLAVEFGWLPGSDARVQACGFHVEGFAYPGSARAMARRVAQLGGDLRFVAMDEPLHFGVRFNGAHACHFSLAEAARYAAEGAAQVRAIFPGVQVGDIEPVGSPDPSWPAMIAAWQVAYQQASGQKLAFLHADVQWRQAWRVQLPLVARAARGAGIPFGIIFDGNGDSDRAWADSAVERAEALLTDPATRPDHAIVESWEEHPTLVLPETEPGTLTNIALRILRLR